MQVNNNSQFLKFQLQQQALQKRNKKITIKKQSAWLYPIAIEKQYFKLLKEIMNKFIEVTNKQIKTSLGIWKEQNKNITGDYFLDSPTDDLEQINQEYINLENQIYGENNINLKSALIPFALQTIIFNDKQFQKVLSSSLNINMFSQEPWREEYIKQFVNNNVNLIKGMTEEYKKKINNAVIDSFQKNQTISTLEKTLTDINYEFANGKPTKIFRLKDGKILRWKVKEFNEKMKDPAFAKRINEIRKEVDPKTGFKVNIETRGTTQSRSNLIARDQISKLNGQVTQKRQQEIGINLYIFETAMDEKVRGRLGGLYPNAIPSHWIMQGKYCTWSDPIVYADTLEEALAGKWKKRSSIGGVEEHPQYPINCRCGASPVFEKIVKEVNNEK